MTTRLRTARFCAAGAVALLALTAGCADDGDTIDDPIDVAEVGVTAIGQADTLACDQDRSTLEAAVEAYTELNGVPPASEADLVGAWLRTGVQRYDLAADGTVVAAPGSSC